MCISEGNYIQKKSQVRKKRGKDDEITVGQVIKKYPHFALVKMPVGKSCFAYDEISSISEREYLRLIKARKSW